MIEPTDEMVEAYQEASWNNPTASHGAEFPNVAEGLAAVLAIVERDYERRRCDDPSWAGHRCTKPQGHPDSHYHRFSGTVWP